MTQFEREVSNLSYTNKDFSTIYPELLDLAKKLSNKWDPTTSNESDPGVVLLKLAALMADKTNYNIDKNILELFPLSVSQDVNARQIFEQCGYCMKHYQSATTIVNLTFLSDPQFKELAYADEQRQKTAVRKYEIPRFTMITNEDSTNVYTFVEPVEVHTSGYSRSINAEVMQGVAMNYAINGNTLITVENLDHRNRIYFAETNIAENGIFVCNKTTEPYNYDEWYKVDNLLIQPSKSKCYKFGLTDGGATCYIEFPEDIAELIDEGIYITYLLTDGTSGNIGKNRLNNWYGDVSVNVSDISVSSSDANFGVVESVIITNKNIKIENLNPSTNGKDPETIEEAYINYEKIKTTFDTLVTVEDYSNALVTTKNASNGFVCDRLNDVQSSYIVMDTEHGLRRNTYHVKSKPVIKQVIIPQDTIINGSALTTATAVNAIVEEPELTAFDLRIYAFEYTDNDGTLKSYVRSYSITDTSIRDIQTGYLGAIRELKSINHDFENFIEDRIILLKNKFPLIARIIPAFKLTPAQQSDIINKVQLALYKQLHSANVSFGEEGSYDLIYDTIIGADPRIKALALDDLTYETYAVFKHLGQFYELRIDDGSQGYYALDLLPSEEFEPVSGVHYYTYVTATDTYEETDDYAHIRNETIYSDEFMTLWKSFRKEIYTQSILAGNTSLFENDNIIEWSANMLVDVDKTTNKAYYLKTSTEMPFLLTENGSTIVYTLNGHTPESTDAVEGVSGVQPNENLIFTRPSLITEKSYAAYCKVLFNIACLNSDGGIIYKNTDYTLGEGEFVVFLWKTEDSDYTPYNYIRYDAGTIISPSYDITGQKTTVTVQGETRSTTNEEYITEVYNLNGTFPASTTGSKSEIQLKDTTQPPVNIKDLTAPQFVLAGERQISIKSSNSISLPKEIYFMLNDGSYTLFDDAHVDVVPTLDNGGIVQDGSNYTITESYTLQTGEYLIYTNATRTQLVMLESGTRITRSYVRTRPARYEPWSIEKYHQVDPSEFIANGVDAINSHWYMIPEQQYDNGEGVTATEMEYVQLGSNIKVELEFEKDNLPEQFESGGNVVERFNVTSSECFLPNCKITYYVLQNNSWVPTELTYVEGNTLCWRAHSILNVNCSNNRYQKLNSTQKVEVLDSLKRKISGLEYENCLIKSNVSINGTGPLINTQTWDPSSGMYVPCSIVSFHKYEGTDSSFTFAPTSVEGTCQLRGPRMTQEQIEQNKLGKGVYVWEEEGHSIRFDVSAKKIYYDGESKYENDVVFNADGDDQTNGLVASCTDTNLLQISGLDESVFGHTSVTFDKYEFTALTDGTKVEFNLPTGNYLFPIVLSAPVVDLSVKLNGTEDVNVVENMLETTEEDWFKTNLRHFLHIVVPEGENTLEFSGKISDSNGITIESPYKYVHNKHRKFVNMNKYPYRPDEEDTSNPDNSITDFSDILSYVIQLNEDKSFNYTYQIPVEYQIECPTCATAFLDKQHVFNHCTICHWDVYSTRNNILVLNKLKQ